MTDTFSRLCDDVLKFKPLAVSIHCGDHRNLVAVIDRSRLLWRDDPDWRNHMTNTFAGLQVLDDPDLPADVVEFRDGDGKALGRFEGLNVKEEV